MFSAKSISQDTRLNANVDVAEFDQAKNRVQPEDRVNKQANFSVDGGWVVLLIGLLGLLGHGFNNHLLKSFIPGQNEEISLFTAMAFFLLGLSLVIQGWRSISQKITNLLLLSVLSIGLYNAYSHFVLAQFQLYLPLLDPFHEIPMAFLTAVQLSVVSFTLLVINRYPHTWWSTIGLGLVGIWLMITVIFSSLGYLHQLPVLFSYVQSVPTVICVTVLGFAFIQQTIHFPGLLSPLTSSLKRVKVLAWLSLCSALIILGAGITIVSLFNVLAFQTVSSFTRDQFLIGFELATIVLSMLVLTLSMRVLFFYETSLKAEANWQQLNLQLEQRVDERTAELENVSIQKSKVLSMVSHDLKTPLAAVGRFAEILASNDDNMSQNQRDLVGYISEGIGQMRVMVTDILDRARIDAGKVTVHAEKIQVETFFRKIQQTIQPLVEEKALELKIEAQSGLEIMADPVLLRQILLNLLSNAIKYNKQQGQIWLRAYENDSGEHTVFEVRDTGIGIFEDQLPLLFTEFCRMGTGMNTMEGTGLGLSYTKKLVELHGGQIEVSSQEGVGSVFTVKIPKFNN